MPASTRAPSRADARIADEVIGPMCEARERPGFRRVAGHAICGVRTRCRGRTARVVSHSMRWAAPEDFGSTAVDEHTSAEEGNPVRLRAYRSGFGRRACARTRRQESM
ncbi:hypothetical protein WG70_12500 [Burkholderia oklahomensis EO147]|nr:hypothetical protein WG70_12500 [Burkholderia oklahomensis EO147]KUY65115.1 hypothetical protein WG70_28280 [Burkholderia oklahomensis EO147]